MTSVLIAASPDRKTAAHSSSAQPKSGGLSFHDVLSALNPLQYLPVVGTIYRAMTGDTINEGVRLAGSMLVSGLMGGPIGLATNIATTIAEKVTGIDPDHVAHWSRRLRLFLQLVPAARRNLRQERNPRPPYGLVGPRPIWPRRA
jgi:hypothetical protein